LGQSLADKGFGAFEPKQQLRLQHFCIKNIKKFTNKILQVMQTNTDKPILVLFSTKHTTQLGSVNRWNLTKQICVFFQHHYTDATNVKISLSQSVLLPLWRNKT